MSQSPRNRDTTALTALGCKRLRKIMDEQCLTVVSLGEKAGVSESSIKNLIAGKSVDKATLGKVLDALKVDPQELLNPKDWQQICYRYTTEHLELTTLPIVSRVRADLKWEDCWIDVILDKRASPIPQKGFIHRSHRGSELFDLSRCEVERELTFLEFCETLKPIGNQSSPKRIALVGGVGAGKTMCLQSLARWLLQNCEGAIVIWSPAQLQDHTVLEHLNTNLFQQEPSTQRDLNELITLFRQGHAWLLLDGANAVTSDASFWFESLNAQLISWLGQANIILSCRSNTWDAESNELRPKFDTYNIKLLQYGIRTQHDQVGQFIDARFRHNPKIGMDLRNLLDRPCNRSLRDLVRNPLHLEFLCYIWFCNPSPSGLPSNCFLLYERYIYYLFELWNFRKGGKKLSLLYQAAEVLALQALDRERSPFRLLKSFIVKTLQTNGFTSNLLNHLEEAGILCLVGVAKENGTEDVYALVHPILQQYFVARSSTDPRFLFNPTTDPQDPSASYRAIQPQFCEVVLLWLEREVLAQSKEALLQALIDFKDDCQEIHSFQAYLIAAIGLSKYKDFTRADEVIERVARWSCQLYDERLTLTLTFDGVAHLATQALLRSDPERVVLCLERLLENTPMQDEFTRFAIAQRLSQLELGRRSAVAELNRLASQAKHGFVVRSRALYQLWQLNQDNPTNARLIIEAFMKLPMNVNELKTFKPLLTVASEESLDDLDLLGNLFSELSRLYSHVEDEQFQVRYILLKTFDQVDEWISEAELDRMLLEGNEFIECQAEELDALLEKVESCLDTADRVDIESFSELVTLIRKSENFKAIFQNGRLLRLFHIARQGLREDLSTSAGHAYVTASRFILNFMRGLTSANQSEITGSLINVASEKLTSDELELISCVFSRLSHFIYCHAEEELLRGQYLHLKMIDQVGKQFSEAEFDEEFLGTDSFIQCSAQEVGALLERVEAYVETNAFAGAEALSKLTTLLKRSENLIVLQEDYLLRLFCVIRQGLQKDLSSNVGNIYVTASVFLLSFLAERLGFPEFYRLCHASDCTMANVLPGVKYTYY